MPKTSVRSPAKTASLVEGWPGGQGSRLGALAYLLLGVAVKHHHGPDGLYERIFVGLELSWFAVAAIAVARRTPATRSE